MSTDCKNHDTGEKFARKREAIFIIIFFFIKIILKLRQRYTFETPACGLPRECHE